MRMSVPSSKTAKESVGSKVYVSTPSFTVLAAHTVDFLVVVEMSWLWEGRADDHGLLRLISERHVHVDGVRAPEVVHVGSEGAFALFHRELQLVPIALDGGDALGGGGGQAGFTHEEDPHRAFCDLPRRPLKAEEGHGIKPHVAVVGDGERHADSVAANVVVSLQRG